MELLLTVVFIFGVIGWSSNRSQKSSSYFESSPYVPPSEVVERNDSRITGASDVVSPNYETVNSDSPKGSSATPSPNLSRGTSVDDFCNKCGKRWRRWDNTENGGYWFSCSGYPRCDNTREKQMREKYCANGHIRTSSNTAYTAAGHRRCLICRPLPEKSVAKSPVSKGGPTGKNERKSGINRIVKSDEFCRNGHRRTPENTYIRPDGERECRVCRRNARKNE
jgi:ssDNA-binding Zn-finger/Zn-ribbon topoisomerase 1